MARKHAITSLIFAAKTKRERSKTLDVHGMRSGTSTVNRTARGRKRTLSTFAHVFDSSAASRDTARATPWMSTGARWMRVLSQAQGKVMRGSYAVDNCVACRASAPAVAGAPWVEASDEDAAS